MLGYVSFFVELIPRAVLAPILIFVALEIVAESFRACPARHFAAVAFRFLSPQPLARELPAAARGARQIAAGTARHHRAREWVYSDRDAVGRFSCRADRSPCDPSAVSPAVPCASTHRSQ